MDELSSMLNQFLNSQDGMAQLQGVLSMLGSSPPQQEQPVQPPPTQSPPQEEVHIDPQILQNLLGMLGGSTQQPVTQPIVEQQPPVLQQLAPTPQLNLDPNLLQGLLSMLGNNSGTSSTIPNPQNPVGGLGGLGSLLEGVDMDTLLKIGSAIATVTAPDKNTALLLALKPHFAPERQKKVDDAVRFMQLLKLYPLVKDTGILKFLGGDDHGTVA